jgi:hypothetical protein
MNTTKIKNGVSIVSKSILGITLFGLVVLLAPSCTKDKTNDNTKAQLSIHMTDAPGNFEAVMVDVQGVEVTGTNGSIVMLDTHSRVYNLLNFSNGVDTLLATGELEVGTVSQIRLILGNNNSVKIDGVVYPISTPSALQSGLKLQVNQTLEAGVSYNILLDFDASQSIVLLGNGEFQLKPVIRTIDATISGSIKGSVTPVGTMAFVTATSNGVTYASLTNSSSEFLIVGLPAGTYEVTVTPILPLLPVVINGKTVTVGVSTNIGIVAL